MPLNSTIISHHWRQTTKDFEIVPYMPFSKLCYAKVQPSSSRQFIIDIMPLNSTIISHHWRQTTKDFEIVPYMPFSKLCYAKVQPSSSRAL